MRIVMIDNPPKSPKELKKRLWDFEGYWQVKLQTLEPHSMNLIDEFCNAECHDRASLTLILIILGTLWGSHHKQPIMALSSIEVDGKTFYPRTPPFPGLQTPDPFPSIPLPGPLSSLSPLFASSCPLFSHPPLFHPPRFVPLQFPIFLLFSKHYNSLPIPFLYNNAIIVF